MSAFNGANPFPLDPAAIERLRGSELNRQKCAADAALGWLYQLDVKGQTASSFDDFRHLPASRYLGVELTESDLSRVWARLESKGFSQGQKTWGGPVLRPVITQAGIELVESGRSALDPSPAGGTHHYVSVNNSNVGNLAWASQNVSQSNISLTSEQVTRALEGLRGALNAALPPIPLPWI